MAARVEPGARRPGCRVRRAGRELHLVPAGASSARSDRRFHRRVLPRKPMPRLQPLPMLGRLCWLRSMILVGLMSPCRRRLLCLRRHWSPVGSPSGLRVVVRRCSNNTAWRSRLAWISTNETAGCSGLAGSRTRGRSRGPDPHSALSAIPQNLTPVPSRRRVGLSVQLAPSLRDQSPTAFKRVGHTSGFPGSS